MNWRIKRRSEEELKEAIAMGGKAAEDAIDHLDKEYYEAVIRFLMAKNARREDAQDIFQDALINLVISIQAGKFKGTSSLKTYLFAISHNLWLNKFNKLVKRERGLEFMPEESISDADIQLMDKEKRQTIESLFSLLGEGCTQVLWLWISDFSMDEIAQRLGYKNGQIARNKKHRCLKRLKKLIGEEESVRNLLLS